MRKDILHNDEADLFFSEGDLAVGNSDLQHVQDIVLTMKGEWKKYPLQGFDALKRIKSRVNEQEFKRDLKIQLAYDNYQDVDIDLSQGYERLKIEL